MASTDACVVVLATGGTIAGRAAQRDDNVGYVAAQDGVGQLIAAVPALARWRLEGEQIAQLDSKDMSEAVWAQLARRIGQLQQRPDVAGIVVTHGTDTLEETAYALHRLVSGSRPVVLTAAMRPASSLQADGPQNLLDAVTVTSHPGVSGVLAVLAGRVLAGHELRKLHNYRIDAFSSGDAGALACIEEGRVRALRPWPAPEPMPGLEPASLPAAWPWVEIVHSHAGAQGRAVDTLLAAGVQGLVVAATGNGSVHADLLAALLRARSHCVPVLRATRCALGALVDDGGPLEGAGGLTPAQARVELMLRLMSGV